MSDKKLVPTAGQTRKMNLMYEALRSSMGNVTEACKKANISRGTHYDLMNKFNTYKKGCEDINEELIDNVESKLLEKIESGCVTSVIFFLKTKGKHRGYTERTEHEIKPVEQFEDRLHIYLPDNNRD